MNIKNISLLGPTQNEWIDCEDIHSIKSQKDFPRLWNGFAFRLFGSVQQVFKELDSIATEKSSKPNFGSARKRVANYIRLLTPQQISTLAENFILYYNSLKYAKRAKFMKEVQLVFTIAYHYAKQKHTQEHIMAAIKKTGVSNQHAQRIADGNLNHVCCEAHNVVADSFWESHIQFKGYEQLSMETLLEKGEELSVKIQNLIELCFGENLQTTAGSAKVQNTLRRGITKLEKTYERWEVIDELLATSLANHPASEERVEALRETVTATWDDFRELKKLVNDNNSYMPDPGELPETSSSMSSAYDNPINLNELTYCNPSPSAPYLSESDKQ